MATLNEMRTALRAAMAPDVTKFSAVEANDAAINTIIEFYGLKDASAREIRARQAEVFAIVEETVEQLLPKAIEDVVGGWVEVKTFARDAAPVFEMKGVGKARARMGITEGARGGVYKARRLDTRVFEVPVKVETVAAFVTLEDILLGTVSLAELMSNITNGFVERIYINSIKALRTAKTMAPAANIKSGNGFAPETIDGLVRIAGAYGSPVIMGFRSALSKVNNGTSWTGVTPSISTGDLDDMRSKGFVGMYKGVPVIEIPNYLADENNNEFVFMENDIFVLPTEGKPVKVAMKGDLHIQEVPHATGSVEQNAHRMIGVGLMLANSICVYTDNDIKNGGKF